MKVSHKKIEMVYPFTGEKIGIDKSISPLMELVWKAGIKTTQCCIRHGLFKKPCTHRTWIVFLRRDDVERFMSVIMSRLDPDDDLVKRISGHPECDGDDVFCFGQHWIFEAYSEGAGDEWEYVYRNGKLDAVGNSDPKYAFPIMLWFPLTDFERVLSIFQTVVMG